jgi:hypothetical protein
MAAPAPTPDSGRHEDGDGLATVIPLRRRGIPASTFRPTGGEAA